MLQNLKRVPALHSGIRWLLLSFTVLSGVAVAESVRLVDLIAEVRAQGYRIIYSSDLVYAGLRVEVESLTLDTLRDVLPLHGLKLEPAGEDWLVRRGPSRLSEEPIAPDTSPLPETMIVTGSRHRFPSGGGASSSRRFASRDLADVPTLASDPARAMLRVPGVSSVGISAKPHIRGGLKDELLILQDGIELVEPFHLADYHSAYSTLNYNTVESVDFYTGGFPSRYGNRMSGVMEINNQWRDRDFATDLGVSSFSSYINTQQALPGVADASVDLAYRQGDLSDLTDYFDTRAGAPEYRDATVRLHLPLADSALLQGGVAYSEDDIFFSDLDEFASSQIDSWYGWLRLDRQLSEEFSSRLSLTGADFRRTKAQENAESEGDPEDPSSFLDYEQEVQRIGARGEFFLLHDQVIHEFGWQLDYSRAEYSNRSRIDRGDLAEIIGTVQEVERDIQLAPRGWSGGVYWAGEYQWGERWLLQPGLRWDWQDYYLQNDTDHQIAPRLGVVFNASESMLLRLSVGRFYQPEGIQELQVLDGIQRFYQPQRSDQFLFGVEWRASHWQLVLETYYKRYANPKGRFENAFNPFVLLPEMESDRLGLLPEKAASRGIDLDLGYQWSPSLSAQLRYSYMTAQDKLEGRWVDRRWSQSHTVNAGLQWQSGGFSLGLALLWHSGWRSTALPGFIAEDDPIDILDYLNNTELREHFSLDISARYTWNFPQARLELYADISNLTNRSNVAGIDFDEEEVEGGFTLEPDRETLLGRVPSIGFTLSF